MPLSSWVATRIIVGLELPLLIWSIFRSIQNKKFKLFHFMIYIGEWNRLFHIFFWGQWRIFVSTTGHVCFSTVNVTSRHFTDHFGYLQSCRCVFEEDVRQSLSSWEAMTTMSSVNVTIALLFVVGKSSVNKSYKKVLKNIEYKP